MNAGLILILDIESISAQYAVYNTTLIMLIKNFAMT